MSTGTRVSRRSFAGLMTAESISLFGSRMTFVAIPWLVLVTTGSATRTGVVALAEMLPYVLASAVGGPLLDRLRPPPPAIPLDLLRAVAVGTIALLSPAPAPPGRRTRVRPPRQSHLRHHRHAVLPQPVGPGVPRGVRTGLGQRDCRLTGGHRPGLGRHGGRSGRRQPRLRLARAAPAPPRAVRRRLPGGRRTTIRHTVLR